MATLSELRTRVRQRTDNEHSGSEFVTDAELTQLINKARLELFGLLVAHGLHTTPETVQTITADGSATYDLDNDFFASLSVFRVDNGQRVRLRRHDHRLRPNTSINAEASSYRIMGYMTDAVIQFDPLPSSGTYEVVYIAAPTDLSADGDTVDGVLGWEEYIVLDVGIDVLNKEGVDATHLKERRAEMAARIKRESSMRDLSEHHQVADVRGQAINTLFDEDGILPGGHRGVFGWKGSL